MKEKQPLMPQDPQARDGAWESNEEPSVLDVGAEEDVRAYAVEKILKRLEDLMKELPGLRLADFGGADYDPEYVHRTRVASRRLRSALTLVGDCAEADTKAFRKKIRALTCELGLARDLDVQILWLESFLAGDVAKRNRPGGERVLLRLRQKRLAEQPRIRALVERTEQQGTLADFARDLRAEQLRLRVRNRERAASKAPKSRSKDVPEALGVLAYETIALKLELFLSKTSFLEEERMTAEHHALRIETKRLRYTLELFADLYGDDVRPFIAEAKALQGALGELHDADVWGEALLCLAVKERKKTIRYYGSARPFARILPGIECVAADRRRFRAEQYVATLTLWHDQCAREVWKRLRDYLEESSF